MKKVTNEQIMRKLNRIEKRIIAINAFVEEVRQDIGLIDELQRKLNEAKQEMRNLEYENWFLKNQDKVSTTTNIKEEKQ